MNRNALRYSIALLLFACLCVAGFLAGYRTGFSNGYASGEAKRQSEDPYPEVYQVGDLIRSTRDTTRPMGGQLDYQSLVDATQSTVFPDEWEALGGPCTMTPLPSLESLVVNATSGVHVRLQTLFGDLSSLRTAVEESRSEQAAMRQARNEWIASKFEPVGKSLGKELTPIDAGIDVVGTWIVERITSDGTASNYRYTFVDADTVLVASSDNAGTPNETWYSVSPGAMVISGKAYLAATTTDDALVLIPNNDAQSFLVATRAKGEPSDSAESQ